MFFRLFLGESKSVTESHVKCQWVNIIDVYMAMHNVWMKSTSYKYRSRSVQMSAQKLLYSDAVCLHAGRWNIQNVIENISLFFFFILALAHFMCLFSLIYGIWEYECMTKSMIHIRECIFDFGCRSFAINKQLVNINIVYKYG